MVLPTAISNSAVKVSLGDDLLVQQDVGEDDFDQAFRLQQPADDRRFAAFPFQQLAGDVRTCQLAAHRCQQQQAADEEHRVAAQIPLGAQPVLRKNTGISTSSTFLNSASSCSWPNQSASITTPARKAPTMKCRPAQSAPKEQAISQIMATYQRSLVCRRFIRRRKAKVSSANATRKPSWRPTLPQSSNRSAPARPRWRRHPGWHNAGCADPSAGAEFPVFQQQHQHRQRGDGAGHAGAQHELPVGALAPIQPW